MSTIQQPLPTPQTPLMDKQGNLNKVWQKFFANLWNRTGGTSGSGGSFALLNGDSTQPFAASTANTSTEVPPLAQVEGLDATVLSSAETYASNAASTAQSNAETYALNQIQNGTGAAFSSITAGASPYTYTAAAVGHLLVSAGTVSAITLNRGSSSLTLPSVSGFIPLDNTDSVTITYSAAPTLNWIPR